MDLLLSKFAEKVAKQHYMSTPWKFINSSQSSPGKLATRLRHENLFIALEVHWKGGYPPKRLRRENFYLKWFAEYIVVGIFSGIWRFLERDMLF